METADRPTARQALAHRFLRVRALHNDVELPETLNPNPQNLKPLNPKPLNPKP